MIFLCDKNNYQNSTWRRISLRICWRFLNVSNLNESLTAFQTNIIAECEIDAFELLTICVDELQQYLQLTGANWCYNLFYRLVDETKREFSGVNMILKNASNEILTFIHRKPKF